MENKFSWTEEYKKTWEEDDNKLDKTTFNIKLMKQNNNRRMLVRQLIVVVDVSNSIEKAEYLPDLKTVLAKQLKLFQIKFVQSNPLSSLSFLTFSDTFHGFASDVDKILLLPSSKSNFSLVNLFKTISKINSNNSVEKEVVLISNSLNTCDSEDISTVFPLLQKNNVKIDIINLAGEVTVFKNACNILNGTYYVPLNLDHFVFIINNFTIPRENINNRAQLLKLGFPQKYSKSGYCTCHTTFHNILYICPNCQSFVCTLPIQCYICNLHLVSPINILINYTYYNLQTKIEEFLTQEDCRVCSTKAIAKCTECSSPLCMSCSQMIINTLNFCLFCEDSLSNDE